MNVEEVKKYIGKKVLLILKNNYKFTTTIPEFDGCSFPIVDKYGEKASIDCDMISLIYEKGEEDKGVDTNGGP